MTNPANAGRSAIPSVFLLGLIAASSPLSLSMHVPSIPGIATALDAEYATVQLTVSAYLLAFAVSQLFVGPLSDRLGRRPVLFGGLGLYVVAATVAAFAPNIETLVAARIVQACGGCAAVVIPRAVVGDSYQGADAARMMALVAMLQSTAPSAAPILGGAIDALLGWRAVFGLLATFGAVLLALAAWRLQETRPLTADGKAVSWHEIATRYGKLLRSRRYLGYTLTFGFGTSGYFGFLAVGPGLMIGALGLTPVEFSLALMTVTVQFIAGSFVSSRLVARFGVDRTLYLGAAIQLTAALALLALSPWLSVVTILLPMWLYAFSNGFIFPNAMAGGTGVDRRIAGAAASFLGFVQLGFGAVIAWAIAALPTDSIVPYGLGLVIFAGVAVSGMVLVRFSPP